MASKKSVTDETATETEAADTKSAATYTRGELQKATIFAGNRDILNALVPGNERVTIEEAQKRIEKFLKGKVN